MNACPVCDNKMQNSFSATLLKKYEVAYYQCQACGLLQTEKPYWLDEAYGDAIAVADTGLVMRNISLASKLSLLPYHHFDPRAAFLDIAGGYGMLTRLMRDYGFDYYWDDKYCQNQLARGFEVDKATKAFAALTAFEVLEHVHDPLSFVKKHFEKNDCRTLIFTTELYEGENPPSKDWWYFAFNTGQHISFYQRNTFEKLAERLGLNFYSLHGLHILTEKTLHVGPLLNIATSRISPLLALLIRKKLGSLTLSDHFMLMNKPTDRSSG